MSAEIGRLTAPEPGSPRDYRADVTRIRRSRLRPRPTDPLYLHLRCLRDDVAAALDGIELRDILDVYCGARPYEPLFPSGARYVGLDIDNAYDCADVVTDGFLPFPDASFDLCLCTQALYFVADVPAAIAEFEPVLRPRSNVLLTVPVVYPGTKLRYTETQLRALFAGWKNVVVVENGKTVVSIVTLIGYLLLQIQKRVPRLFRPGFAVAYLLLNVAGAGAERIERRYLESVNTTPANLLLRATRP